MAQRRQIAAIPKYDRHIAEMSDGQRLKQFEAETGVAGERLWSPGKVALDKANRVLAGVVLAENLSDRSESSWTVVVQEKKGNWALKQDGSIHWAHRGFEADVLPEKYPESPDSMSGIRIRFSAPQDYNGMVVGFKLGDKEISILLKPTEKGDTVMGEAFISRERIPSLEKPPDLVLQGMKLSRKD
ncbi:MAG: hypothetical protein V1875_06635 [Candidatus Altiarchaeota archaeon]